MSSIDFFHSLFSSRCSRTPLGMPFPVRSCSDTRRKSAFLGSSAPREKSTWNDGALGPFLPCPLDAGNMLFSAYSVSEGGKTGKLPPLTLSFCVWPEPGAASTSWSSAFPRAASSLTDNWREPRAYPAGLAPRAARWPPARAGKPYPGIASSPPEAVLPCANRSPACSGGFSKAKASAWLTAASLSPITRGRRRRDLRSGVRNDPQNWSRGSGHRKNPRNKVAPPATAEGHPSQIRTSVAARGFRREK